MTIEESDALMSANLNHDDYDDRVTLTMCGAVDEQVMLDYFARNGYEVDQVVRYECVKVIARSKMEVAA